MSVEKRNEAPAEVERAASHAVRNDKAQKPVYVYLVALFAIALLLMSLSFFMSHRSNQEVLGELQENVNSFQLLQEAEERNAELMKQVSALEKELDQQRDTIFELQQQVSDLEKQLKEADSQIPQIEE